MIPEGPVRYRVRYRTAGTISGEISGTRIFVGRVVYRVVYRDKTGTRPGRRSPVDLHRRSGLTRPDEPPPSGVVPTTSRLPAQSVQWPRHALLPTSVAAPKASAYEASRWSSGRVHSFGRETALPHCPSNGYRAVVAVAISLASPAATALPPHSHASTPQH